MLSRTGREGSAFASGIFKARAAAATLGAFPDAPRADRRHAVAVVCAARDRAIAGSRDGARARREALSFCRARRDGSSAPPRTFSRGFAAGTAPRDAPPAPPTSRAEAERAEDERLEDERLDASKRAKDDDRDATRALVARLLTAATRRVAELGWSEAALRAAADDLGYSRAVAGAVKNGVGSLVHHFCEDCDSRLSVRIVLEQEDALDPLPPSERLATAIKWRLECVEPVIETWPAALAIQAAPENAAATATRVALLADELVGTMGAQGVGLTRATRAAVAPGLQDPIPPEKAEASDEASSDETSASAEALDAETRAAEKRTNIAPSPIAAVFASAGWYADRAAVAALYGACELFMVGDTSPGFEDTKRFVDSRARELVQFAATAEEAATSAAAASRSIGIEPQTLEAPFPLPNGAKQLMEGVFAKVLEAATRAERGTTR